VLGLLINSAKTNFEAQRDEIRHLTANLILLDTCWSATVRRPGRCAACCATRRRP